MFGAAVAPTRQHSHLRYNDYGVHAWLLAQGPCRWRGKTDFEFRAVALRSLQAAWSGKNPEIVSQYVRCMKTGKRVAPLVVCETGSGTYYIHDGNHRHQAMRSVLKDPDALVRVAVVVPRPGYYFRWRWFSTYGTFVLEPERRRSLRPVAKPVARDLRLAPLLGSTLVLVAHPDDETGGCAALLQRVREPIVVYATDGAPDDEFFWGRWRTRDAYRRVRRSEARRALSVLGVRAIHFLEDHAPTPGSFGDQQLHKSVPAAVLAMLALVEHHRPDAILVPAYEGGHPDHDTCSFIGSVVGRLTSLPVWEMPLYYRSPSGELVCQRFQSRNHTEVTLRLTMADFRNRGVLISTYASQTDLGQFLTSKVEHFRPQPRYDYTQPPHEGTVNYEAWGWPVSAVDLCCRFRQCAVTMGCAGLLHDAVSHTTDVAVPVRPSLLIQPNRI